MRILVTGYYGQNNLGDDAFQHAIPLVVGKQHTYDFVHHLRLLETDPNALYDAVLVGGGDVVTPYFFAKIQAYLKSYTRGPVLLFGAGLTWPSCVELGHLDPFDSVFLRNTTDLRRAERRLGTQWVHYIPDLAFALEPYECGKEEVKDEKGKEEQGGGDTLTASTGEQASPALPQTAAAAAATASGTPVMALGEKDDSVYSYSAGSSAAEMEKAAERPQAAFYLIQSIESENPADKSAQEHVIDKLAACVAHVAKTHDVALIRFNTSGKRDSDDLYISQSVARLALAMADANAHVQASTAHAPVRIVVDQTEYRTPQAMLERMAQFDVNVCMRFHSHIFSIIQQVPFVSLTLTRKVEMLVDELGLAKDCAVKLEFNPNTLQPTNLNFLDFKCKFQYVVENSDAIRERLRRIYELRHALLLSGKYGRLVENARKRPTRRSLEASPDAERNEQIDSLVEKGARWWRHRLRFRLDDEHARALRVPTRELTPIRDLGTVRRHVSTVCERLTYEITKQVQASYLYGFVENMMENPFRIREYLQWIVEDFNRQKVEQDDGRRFNLDFIRQQDFAGAHRSGWSFAVNHLRSLHSDSGVLLDTCMDRTFHWGCDALTQASVLPYTQSWCGIVHHTPLEAYTDYNVAAMVRNPLFQQSLPTCRGIYVLSQSLKNWFTSMLETLHIIDPPPVEVLTHPTEVPPKDRRFSLQKFLANRDRKMVHIGAWLRDTFAFYEMGVLDSAEREVARARSKTPTVFTQSSVGYTVKEKRKLRLRRAMLQGRNMNLYMPPKQLLIADASSDCAIGGSGGAAGFPNDCTVGGSGGAAGFPNEDLSLTQNKNGESAGKGGESESSNQGNERYETRCNNKWVDGLRKFVDDRVRSTVDVLQGLNDQEYDKLLEENIVFLRLFDASACNTLIECLVRNVPILINPLPAVVEVLGDDYPFYYNTLGEALIKSRSYETIAAAHRYLARLDKSKYRVESFIDSIHSTAIYKSLGAK